MDSRAYRLLPVQRKVKVFEVDAPHSQAVKRAAVQRLYASRPHEFLRAPSQVTYVSCDFTKENFLDLLLATGEFDVRNPNTTFLMEGVASYLTWEDLKATLETVSRRCAPGTRFAFNVLFTDTTSAESNAQARRVQRLGEPWKFGLKRDEDVEARFGASLGFQIDRHVTFVESVRERLSMPDFFVGSNGVDGRLVFMRVSDT